MHQPGAMPPMPSVLDQPLPQMGPPPPPPMQQQGMYAPYPQQHPPPRMPVSRPAKLDYHAVPSVADLIDKEINSYTQTDRKLVFKAPATLPPLAATLNSSKLNISLQDAGCARPCFIRSTIYQVPITKDMLETSGLEFAMVVKPFDDGELNARNQVMLSESEVSRCNRCNAFANPFSRDGRCCICGFTITGLQDHDPTKPELYQGSYEFRNLTKEYYRDRVAGTRRPHIIFVIEMTAHSRHMVHYISKNLAAVIKDHFPTDFMYPGYQLAPLVGFATYNSKITIYDVLNGGHGYVVSDVSSVVESSPTSKFLVDPFENFEAISKFLDNLPVLCGEQLETEQQTVLGPVIEAVLKSCLHDTSNQLQKQNNKVIPAGKLYILHSSLPTSGDDQTPGRLSARRNIDDIKRELGKEENKVLVPEGTYYSKLAEKCINDYATGVELFLFPPNPRTYLNIVTIGDLARLTGTGVVHKYHAASLNNFIEDLKFSLKSTMGFDASMRVRTSTGISPVKYIGNFNNTYGSNLEMSTVNSNSNFIVQMKYDDKIPENDLVVVQFAMLYTSVCGERRVRVHNIALTACQTYEDLYKMSCCDTLMNVLVRDLIDRMRSAKPTLNPRPAKEELTKRLIHILAAYRKHCTTSSTSSSQLILPEGLKLLPVYLCGALKCDAIDGGQEMFPDDKVLAQINLLGALPAESQVTLYPRMYAIEACSAEDEDNEFGLVAKLTRCLRLIIEEEKGQCYVLENGYYLFIFFPSSELGQNFLGSVYGAHKDDQDLLWGNRQRDSQETKFLENLIDQVKIERRRALIITVIRQGRDKLENVFNSFLYEDKKRPEGVPIHSKFDDKSYVDMLCYLHTEIMAKWAS